jgi:enoyl-CoA hydratase/carnithine racemase
MDRLASNELVRLSVSDGVAEIRMVNEPKRNAFSIAQSEDFAELLEVAMAHDGTDVILVTAEGPVFSGGADVDILAGGAPEEQETLGRLLLDDICHPLHRTTIPVVAAARGPAAGGGATILCYSADLQVVSPDVRIWWPEVEYGAAPLGRGVYLANQIGESRALELMALGEAGSMSAEEGHRLGLFTRLVEDDRVEAEAREVADLLATHNREHDGIVESFVDAVYHSRQESYGISMDYAHSEEQQY